MTFWLWEKLPAGLLKIKQRRWSALDYDVKLLIVGLAREQGFKCAHCHKNRNLEIEHDHYPEHGRGDRYTVYNVRGLVCRGCNRDIGTYDAEKRGELSSWPASPRISEHDYGSYVYAHECRVSPLLVAVLEERLGVPNYWRRRNLLFKFDDWTEWGGKRKKRYPWYWGFDEIKDKKYGYFRTTKRIQQLLGFVTAYAQYVEEQQKKDPEYHPPEAFLELIFWLKPILERVRSGVEAKLSAEGRGEDVKSAMAGCLARDGSNTPFTGLPGDDCQSRHRV